MDKSRLTYLIDRYSNNTAASEELKELSGYIGLAPDDELFAEVMQEQQASPIFDLQSYQHLAENALQRNPMIPKWVWAAACLLILVSGSFYFFQKQPVTPLVTAVVTPQSDIVPSIEGAILTLADGSKIVLDSAGNGKVASQQGADIILNQGQLSYDGATNNNGEVVYNTLSTPKGRQFHILLADGTEVWLNAGSSIRYPTAFIGADRVVEITGEAYFEVAKDAAHPFKVKTGRNDQVEVLGTHFNVNAYENTICTLLEGKVQIANSILKPGQEYANGIIREADVEKAIAWKNGIFDFTDEPLQTVMKQLERWYDIEVAYEKNVPPIRFYGKMTKNISLNDLVIILEKSKLHFQLEGRKLIVKP